MPSPHASLPSILFCGKHRVNYAMFNPVYQALRRRDDIRLMLSSGRYRLRFGVFWHRPQKAEFLNEVVFGDFDVDPNHLIRTSHHDRNHYNVYVTSNASSRMQPPSSDVTIQIFHGVSFRNFAVRPHYTRFDKLFFPGRYMMEQYLRQGYLEEGDPRIELMGMPKLDRLVDGSISREQVLESLDLDPGIKTVLWCPTGARYNSFEELGHAGMKAVGQTGCNLIIKLHDHPHLGPGQSREDVLAYARAGLGERMRLVDHSDVAPLLVAADLLISDASSVAYEYCLLDRPIVFVDVPKLLEERAALPNSNMDTETHGRRMGKIVRGAGELGRAVEEELGHPDRLSAERRAAAEHIFYKPGSATQRMADRLVQLAREGKQSVPEEREAIDSEIGVTAAAG